MKIRNDLHYFSKKMVLKIFRECEHLILNLTYLLFVIILSTNQHNHHIYNIHTMTKNISIITNFGCRAKCWYCIWKGHPYEKVQLETDWNKLEQFLYQNRDKGKVSVSGGGDCLYNNIFCFWVF